MLTQNETLASYPGHVKFYSAFFLLQMTESRPALAIYFIIYLHMLMANCNMGVDLMKADQVMTGLVKADHVMTGLVKIDLYALIET